MRRGLRVPGLCPSWRLALVRTPLTRRVLRPELRFFPQLLSCGSALRRASDSMLLVQFALRVGFGIVWAR